MKSRSSTIQISPTDHFFTVYPLSIQFERQYNTKFHLYFQKSLQIISKYECPAQSVKKNQLIRFNAPQSVNHFRVLNQKNFEYQWSLYIFRIDMDQNNEEFVEGQKITIKNEWNDFKMRKGSIFQNSVNFNSLRCKFTYLVMIGSSNNENLETIQRYFNEHKPSVLTNDQKMVTPQESIEPVKVQQASKIQKVERLQVKGIKKQLENQVPAEKIEQTDDKALNKVDELKFSQILKKQSHKLQIPAASQQIVVHQQINEHFLATPHSDINLKLSNSDHQIGNQIQEKVKTKESLASVQNNQLNILKETEEKKIVMTSSQLLNEKGQPIYPWYQKKHIVGLLVLIVLIILGGGIWMLKKKLNKAPNAQLEKKGSKNKKPIVEEKQTKQAKQTKGKEQVKKSAKAKK